VLYFLRSYFKRLPGKAARIGERDRVLGLEINLLPIDKIESI